jgi:Bardet-Biedl syndrome 5 protein
MSKNPKGVKKQTEEAPFIWHDREIRFDVAMKQLSMTAGEQIVDSMNDVEDTKGNNGDRGCMIITNLRMIWFCEKDKHINLTIGFDCVLGLEIKDV